MKYYLSSTVYLLLFLLLPVLWISYPRNHCQMQCHKVFPLFPSKSLIILTVTCRSLIQFFCMVGSKSLLFFCHVGYLVFPAQGFEMTVISLLIGLDILVRNHLTIDARVYFQALYFIGLYIFQMTFSKSLVGSSLVVQWLEFDAFTALAYVQSLVRVLRSHKPGGVALGKRKSLIRVLFVWLCHQVNTLFHFICDLQR